MPQPKKPAQATRGKLTEVTIALMPQGIRTPPTSTSLTASAATKGATSVTVTGVTSAIQAGQALLFIDPTTDSQHLAIVSATAAASATSLTVLALGEAIPAGAIAQYPPRFMLRTTADLNTQTDTAEVDSMDHNNKDFIPLGSSSEFSLDGMYTHYDPGRHTCAYADRNKLEIYWTRTYGPPNANYSKGETHSGFGIVTAVDEPNSNDDMVQCAVTIQVTSRLPDVLPTPIA
jgi:hypothetical protein